MKTNIKNAIDWIKEQDVDACISGSCLLDYFDEESGTQDIDIFCYNEQSFTKLAYAMTHNKMFLLTDPLEQWKFDNFTSKSFYKNIKKYGIISIKFKYNMLIDINLIYKRHNRNAFDVVSSFDMDIVCKAYDIKTGLTLDLTRGDNPDRIADWNRWNNNYYDVNIWSISLILRQFKRVVKYHNRGYNTDLVCLKYKEILADMIKYESIFDSVKVEEKITSVRSAGAVLLDLYDIWLAEHKLSDDELELLNTTIKKL